MIKLETIRKSSTFLFLLILGFSIQAQIASEGLPPYKIFKSKDYHANPQNWDVIQDNRGVIYTANTEGVFEFDGESWRTVWSGALTRCFGKDDDGVIYVGMIAGFGFLAPGKNGQMEYVPLSNRLKNKEITVIESILVCEDKVYFVSYHDIYIYSMAEDTITIVGSSGKIYPSFVFHNKPHFIIGGFGFYNLSNDELVPAVNGNYFKDIRASTTINMGKDTILTLDANSGAHIYTGDTVFAISEFEKPFFKNNWVYKAISLKGGYLALCFLKGGVVILDGSFNPVLHLDKKLGFESQAHRAYQDNSGDLWICTNSNIVFLNLTSPISMLDDKMGLEGAVYDMKEKDGNLYVTGNSGVFFKPWRSDFDILETPDSKVFTKVQNSEIIGVQLIVDQDEILSIHTKTIGSIANENFKPLLPLNSYMSSATVLKDDAQVLTTSSSGNRLELFEFSQGHWTNKPPVINDSLPGDLLMKMAYDPFSGRIWACNYQAMLLSFKYDPKKNKITDVRYYDETNGLPPIEAGMRWVFQIEDSVMFATSEGLYRPLLGSDSIVRDPRFEDYFSGGGFFYLTKQDSNNYWYSTRSNKLGRIILKDSAGNFRIDEGFSKNLEITTSAEIVLSQGKGVLIGGLEGLVVIDPNKSEDYNFSYSPLIRRVDFFTSGDSTIFNGFFLNEDSTSSLSQKTPLELDSDQNALRFVYSVPYFKGGGQLNYQIKLDGFDEDWSAWSEKNEKEYTNIPGGSYRFMVRAQNVFGVESEIATFNFIIATPWYLTTWAYAAYFILFILTIWTAVKINSRRLQRENEKLEQTILERTQEIRYQAEKLQTLDNAKSRFFANISHELRTPLTLIQGPLESVLNGSLGKVNDKIKSNLDLSRTSTKKLLNLVEEILDLSKLEAGNLELKTEAVRFHDLVRRIFFTYQSSYSAKSIEFQFDYQLDEDAIFSVDIGKLEKVLDNLMSNAVKFTEANGLIKMEVSTVNEKITIKISDTGIGIGQDELDQIFNRFYQAGKDTKYTGGTGIGLSLAKELGTLMHGDLQVTSKLGEGTAFTLTIPMEVAMQEDLVLSEAMDEKNEPVFDEPETTESDPLNLKAAKILVVEDDDAMRGYIKSQLDSYSLDEAANGLSAIEKIETNSYDLIITDLMMPKLDGLDLVAHIRSNESTKNISVIMLTARAADEDIVGALTIGVNDYMIKPFNPEELKARVVNVLTNRMVVVSEEEKPTSADEKLVAVMKEIVKANMKSRSFNVTSLANEVSISERQLSRNIQQITGLTAGNFIREVRLNEARILLENRTYTTISEVCYAVGFEKPGYFSEIYTKRFGKKPVDYL